MNIQQVNGLKCSVATIAGEEDIPVDDLKQYAPEPFRENGLSLLISKSLYTKRKEDLDNFLKTERLVKKEFDNRYWEISD